MGNQDEDDGEATPSIEVGYGPARFLPGCRDAVVQRHLLAGAEHNGNRKSRSFTLSAR